MATQQKNKQVLSNDHLLTAHEQAACMQIAEGEAPHNQRALALLALNEGHTQAQAAEKSGLSAGQVKYWVARFRDHRLGIFPDDLLDKPDVKADIRTAKEIEVALKASEKGKDSSKAESKSPKNKKDKKSKKKDKKSEKKSKKDKRKKKSKKKK